MWAVRDGARAGQTGVDISMRVWAVWDPGAFVAVHVGCRVCHFLLRRPASSVLIVGLAKYPYQGSCFGGRLFSSPVGETAGSIMCRLRDFPTVRYQKLVGGEAESCLREADVPEFQGFGIFAEYYHSKA